MGAEGGSTQAAFRGSVLLRPTAIRAGIVAAILAAAGYALLAGRSGVESLFPSDADLFLRVAGDPFGDGGAIGDPGLYGTSYRYGRILYPLAAWAVALGRQAWVDWTLLLLSAAGAGLAVACGLELMWRRVGTHPRLMWLLVVPAFWMGLRGAFSEWFVLGLVLLVFLLELDGRRLGAGTAAALLLLSREAMAVALLPAVYRDLRSSGLPSLRRWVAIVAPLVAWYGWVWARVGSLPFLDDSVSRREAVDLPGVGLVEAWRELGADGVLIVVVVLAVITIAAAVVAHVASPWFPVSHAAVALSVVIVFFGVNVWRFPGEALRTMMHAQVLAAMAVAGVVLRRTPATAGDRRS